MNPYKVFFLIMPSYLTSAPHHTQTMQAIREAIDEWFSHSTPSSIVAQSVGATVATVMAVEGWQQRRQLVDGVVRRAMRLAVHPP